MTLLVGLIIFGSLIMINLIVAIIVSDVNSLANAAKEQVLFNKVEIDSLILETNNSDIFFQANHAVHVTMLTNFVYKIVGCILRKNIKYW